MGRISADQGSLAVTGKIAIVSVVMPKVADTSRESNKIVLQATVNHALESISKNLQGLRPWSVVDLSGGKAAKTLRSFGAITEDEARIIYPVGDGPVLAKKELDQARSRWKEGFISAEQLPSIPRSAFVPEQGAGKQEYPVQPIMLEQAGKLCRALGVDAVLFVQIGAAITHPRENTFIVRDNRTDGTVHMAQTMIVVDKTGRIIADLGHAALDDRSAFRDMLPVYVGAGRDAVKPENIDLVDPRKKTGQALRSIIEETSADLSARFKGAAGF